jgi:hypothetical protein
MKQKAQMEQAAPIVEGAPVGVAAVRSLIESMKAAGIARAEKRLSDGCAYSYNVADVKGANLTDARRVVKHATDNATGRVRVTFTAAHVCASCCVAWNITAQEFDGLASEFGGSDAPYFAAVVRKFAPKAALLAALKL